MRETEEDKKIGKTALIHRLKNKYCRISIIQKGFMIQSNPYVNINGILHRIRKFNK
jgi:hypothetical protein